MAFLIIRVSDQAKYGTFKKVLVSQFYLEKSIYLMTILDPVDILNNHKFDMKYY